MLSANRLFLVWCVVLVVDLGFADPMFGQVSFLDNATVRIGVDPSMGGCITYFADSVTGQNVVNTYDLGREIQQSYYSGPQPYGNPSHPDFLNWPWNPIGCGDVYGNRATTLEHSNDGKTIYVKTLPLQWALDGVACECTFETWIELEGNTARVYNRLTNQRSDHTQYPAMGQEFPAVYTVGTLYRLFAYTGSAPFTSAPLQQVPVNWPPSNFQITENWAALVNDANWGLGIYHPRIYRLFGGFLGTPNTGGPTDFTSGYMNPTLSEILD